MARASIRVGHTGAVVGLEVEGVPQTEQAFKDARRAMRRDLGRVFGQAAEEVALPRARSYAGNLKVQGTSTASQLVVRRRTASAYLTCAVRGKLGRAIGLQEFGGTVRTIILPKKGRAVVVNGQPVANVTTPRHYTGRFFMTRSIDEHLPELHDVILRGVREFFGPLVTG